VLDPATYPDIYNDMYVKRYAEQLIKMQWGNNLKKFEGVQLPGGVTLNGQKIFDEAVEEIEKIRQEVQDSFQLPVDFFTG
jgi:ABC-type phosphate transport system ATPase subunit